MMPKAGRSNRKAVPPKGYYPSDASFVEICNTIFYIEYTLKCRSTGAGWVVLQFKEFLMVDILCK